MKEVSISLLNVNDSKRKELTNTLIDEGMKWVHYDFIDNIFVKGEKNIEINEIIKNVNEAKKHIVDIHLMVSSPERWIEKVKRIADYITFHFESESYERIEEILKTYGNHKIGIAINPSTNIEQIYGLLNSVSHILIMSVIPGRGGQSFIPESLDKIKKLYKYMAERNIEEKLIIVDGGINDTTGPQAISAGANVLVSGTFLSNKPTKQNLKNIIG